jgi:hypothetical protein
MTHCCDVYGSELRAINDRNDALKWQLYRMTQHTPAGTKKKKKAGVLHSGPSLLKNSILATVCV